MSWQPPTPEPVDGSEQEEAPIEPELLRVLLEMEEAAEPDEYVRIILRLHEQTNLKTAAAGAQDAAEARSRVVSALQASAARSQAPLLAYLEEARAAGLVESYTPFWIFNGIAVRARPSLARALATRPDVAAVHLDHYRRWLTTSSIQHPVSSTQYPVSSIEWSIARIRADRVWASLHISGTGAVVAGMDTGVDWLHPALQANYRAYNSHGPSNHVYSWYDATGGGALYPVDGHGHGTHTLGTAVGRDGIGVAPGARWIAVKVLDNQGSGYDSWIHDGFQWLLAPGGDPAQAPDVVNCSWGNENGRLTTFQDDLRALRAAGILSLFSNGNNGPKKGTVGAPASLPEAFAVGASDSDDEVAIFSSRGPSSWGEIRPHAAAPGVDVRSSTPGGAYGLMDGTSMAVPHASGIVALLRSVSPTLSITRAAFIITSTAVPLGTPIPNNDAGWGRVDAFAAVASLSHPGLITGTVVRADDGVPIAEAMVTAVSRGGEGRGAVATGDDGSYLLALAPTTYDLTASAFGYESVTALGVEVMTDTTTMVNFALTPLPSGTLRGQVTDAATGVPVTATIAVLDTPFEVTASSFNLTLPAGTYTVRARSVGHRVITATVHVVAGQVAGADLALPPAPSILLVDSGLWYYGSQADYFRQALDDLAYAYDERAIKHLPDDVPAATALSSYDLVIWSAPEDAPGYIGAEDTIIGYLSAGGRLLLTGQDIGFWDGGGAGYWRAYYRDYLKAGYVRDNAEAWVLEGVEDDIFAGIAITITGPGGADNQCCPDEIAVADPDAAVPVLAYQRGGCGGIRAGTCLDYRVIYLSFGFEAINDLRCRREMMGQALDWLTSSPPAVGLELKPASQVRIGLPGSVVTFTLRVRHVGQAGATDVVGLSLDGTSWAAQLGTPSVSLTPCASTTVMVTVTIPSAAGWDAQDVMTLSARSSLSPTLVQTAVVMAKAPAPILLVDDERWYNEEARYEAALADGGFVYDYWWTAQAGGAVPGGNPTLDVLQRYPIVVWFTGYDWFRPVTADEEAALAAYLDGGGRLFLSSQDFLYYHRRDPFNREYLGVMTYTQDVTPTLAYGVPENAIGDRLGPYLLDYPFRNWSDAVVPAPGTAVLFREHGRRPIALGRQREIGGADEGHKTVFFSFPFEALPETGRAEVMERIVGWLSWLGGSTFTADRGTVAPGDAFSYILCLANDGPDTVTASLSNTLPADVRLVPGSWDKDIVPGSYDPVTRCLSWSGPLDPGETVTFAYRVTAITGTALSGPIVNIAHVGLEDHHIRFHRTAVVRVGAPDLSPSAFWCSPSPARPGTVVTCTLALANVGLSDALTATAAISLPVALPVSSSLNWIGGGTGEVLTGTVRWTGAISAGRQVTLTFSLALPTNPVHPPLYSDAFLEDGIGGAWERATWLLVEPLRRYLPLILRDGPW